MLQSVRARPIVRSVAGLTLAVLGLSLSCISNVALAQNSDTVKIGILTDMSGPYSAMGGQGSVVAAKLAIEDCLKAECKGMKIEVLSADNQNKPDVGVTRAREWLDRDKVEAIADLTNSSVALAVQKLIKEKGGIAMYSGPATGALTTAECATNGFHWMFDTYSQAAGAAAALTKLGNKSWYFVTVDYAFGHSLEKDASDVVKANGGTVLGAVRHPLNASDFSSFMLQAQASKAQIVALANAGGDTVNSIKAANEFGLTKSQTLVPLVMFLGDIHSLGLKTAQGMMLTDAWYWDTNDETRKFGRRFFEKTKRMPSFDQAGVYSAVTTYLKAIKAVGTDDADKVMVELKKTKINDVFAKNGYIRQDGRMVHDMYLMQVKKPEDSKYPWDYYKLKATIPAEQAFQPLSKSTCPMIKK